MSTAEPTPDPASASFGPVGERKGSVQSGDERLSPYLVAAARAVALPAPRVPGRADCALRSVAQSVTLPRRSYSPAIVRDRAGDGCEVDCGGWLGLAAGRPSRSTRCRTRRPNRRTARGQGSSVWALAITAESAPRSSDTPAWRRATCGHAFDNEKAAMRYQHACERFSGVSDVRPAPRPRCAAGTGGSRADRRTTRPACRSARRPCPSVHPAAQWCALRRRPTHGRR